MLKKLNNRKGFTLIELIVVIAIIAVLAAIIIPTVATNIQRANDARDVANTRSALAEWTLLVVSADAGVTTPPQLPQIPGQTGDTRCTGTANMTTRVVEAFECIVPNGTFRLVNGQITKITP